MTQRAFNLIYSPALFAVARDAKKRAKYSQFDSLVAIVFAAAGFEGFLNELLVSIEMSAAADPDLPASLRALAVTAPELESRNAQIGLKVQVCHVLLTGRPYNPGTQPYQDLDLLFRVRNALVHMRPESYSVEDVKGINAAEDVSELESHKIVRQLRARGVIERGDGAWLPLLPALMNPGVAAWAFGAAGNTAKALAELFPEGPYRDWALERCSDHADYIDGAV